VPKISRFLCCTETVPETLMFRHWTKHFINGRNISPCTETMSRNTSHVPKQCPETLHMFRNSSETLICSETVFRNTLNVPKHLLFRACSETLYENLYINTTSVHLQQSKSPKIHQPSSCPFLLISIIKITIIYH
jgi:hypothetical protein